MNRLLAALLLILLLPGTAFAAEPQISSAGAALIEANTGTLLFSVNGETPLPPASTTKILTALLTLDLAPDLQRDYRIREKAAAVEESSIQLQAGEELNLQELLTGALIHSGNDACYAIGEAVAGDEDLFVRWLNMKAAAMGAYSLDFRNTNGLPDDAHVVSAEDLARITAAAMEQPFFAETVGSKYASLGEGSHYRYYRNTNKLLWQDEHITGVKTGTTDAAGPCLVAAYEDGAAEYISVVFHSPDRYGESLSLLNYAADTYILVFPIRQGEPVAYQNGCLYYAGADLMALMKKEEAEGLRFRWEFQGADGENRLSLLSASGQELARIPLEKKIL